MKYEHYERVEHTIIVTMCLTLSIWNLILHPYSTLCTVYYTVIEVETCTWGLVAQVVPLVSARLCGSVRI